MTDRSGCRSGKKRLVPWVHAMLALCLRSTLHQVGAACQEGIGKLMTQTLRTKTSCASCAPAIGERILISSRGGVLPSYPAMTRWHDELNFARPGKTESDKVPGDLSQRRRRRYKLAPKYNPPWRRPG
ncbi:hypothetical protein CCMA1212_003471 [Trichoderma ghanense]|uniref:Uncharacterized protein n=1 Tax=Trichoderma ghanense TaxID=65468 RepID=A0ABY2H8Q1_9HYPO